jgi:hypothetical protein
MKDAAMGLVDKVIPDPSKSSFSATFGAGRPKPAASGVTSLHDISNAEGRSRLPSSRCSRRLTSLHLLHRSAPTMAGAGYDRGARGFRENDWIHLEL